jgi:hypothetical protein
LWPSLTAVFQYQGGCALWVFFVRQVTQLLLYAQFGVWHQSAGFLRQLGRHRFIGRADQNRHRVGDAVKGAGQSLQFPSGHHGQHTVHMAWVTEDTPVKGHAFLVQL